MTKPWALALLVAGIVLLVFGVNASHSFTSGFSRAFTGAPTDKAIWLMAVGAIAAVAGAVGVARS